MPREYKHLEPVTERGLESNVPDTQKLWDKLDGVRVDQGGFRKRPAITQTGSTTAVVSGNAQLIYEFIHNLDPVSEIIRPDADGYYSDGGAGATDWNVYNGGLTALYEGIDEETSDEFTTLIIGPGSLDTDRKGSVTFANPNTSFSTIDKVTLFYRAYTLTVGSTQTLNIKHRRSNTDYTVGSDSIPNDNTFADYTHEMTTDPATSAAWNVTDLDDLEIVFDHTVAAGIQTLRITQAYITIEGVVGAGRTNSKLYITSDGFKRLNEDMDTYTDISGSATTPTVGETDRWDYAQLGTYTYIVNGTDDVYYYPDGSNEVIELAGEPSGKTIAAIGNRLLLGDITDGGTRTKQKLQWCVASDPTDWDAAGSGTMDLDETQGAIVKLKHMIERGNTFTGIVVAYKEIGIYHIEYTGSAGDEFSKRVIDGDTGCYAMSSVQGYINNRGEGVHAFLGHSGGNINVFEYNGNVALPIGNPIRDALDAEINYARKHEAFALVDPNTNTYNLFVATSNATFPTKVYSYDIETQLWTNWLVPEVTAGGQWLVSDQWTGILGKADALAYKADKSVTADDTTNAITQEFQTGDVRLAEPWERSTVYRVWLWYRDQGACDVTVSISNDGGLSYDDTDTVSLAGLDDQVVKMAQADLVLEGRTHRLKLEANTVDEELDLVGLTVEFERKGVQP